MLLNIHSHIHLRNDTTYGVRKIVNTKFLTLSFILFGESRPRKQEVSLSVKCDIKEMYMQYGTDGVTRISKSFGRGAEGVKVTFDFDFDFEG